MLVLLVCLPESATICGGKGSGDIPRCVAVASYVTLVGGVWIFSAPNSIPSLSHSWKSSSYHLGCLEKYHGQRKKSTWLSLLREGQGVDAVGGAEAIISHVMSQVRCGLCPCICVCRSVGFGVLVSAL